MSRQFHVLHDTRYAYGAPVSLSRHLVHMSPRDTAGQRCLQHDLLITPTPNELSRGEDWFGNHVVRMTLTQQHSHLRVLAASTVELAARPARHREAPGPAWETVVTELARYPGEAPLEAIEAAHPSPLVPVAEALREWVRPHFTPGRPLLEATRALMHQLFEDFTFDATATTVSTPVLDVLKLRRGVCQDFSHLMIAALRSLGLAARYMSGYLLTTPPPGKPRMIGADASHAWLALWCPGQGWVEFDPTNDVQPGDEHIVLGWGRDFEDVTPMRGIILSGAHHEVDVEVTVMPAEGRTLKGLVEAADARYLAAQD